ncbi:MAG: hypothetical protein KAT43_03990 [Nanoarchaeota archaeon]|nr:hypothetical protein [Nanoarchaeota archaeon]
MEINLTLEELLSFSRKRDKFPKHQKVLDDHGIKLIEEIGKGSSGTFIYAAVEIKPADAVRYCTPFKASSKIDDFHQTVGVSKEESKTKRTNSKFIAVKLVGKKRLGDKVKNILTTSSGGRKTEQGPGRISGDKYLKIIMSLMQIDNPYIVKYYPDKAVITHKDDPEKGVIFLPMELLNFKFSETSTGKNSLDLLYEILRGEDEELKRKTRERFPGIFAKICFGLEKAYEISPETPIIHRDLKPANIMFDFLSKKDDVERINYYDTIYGLSEEYEWDLREILEKKLKTGETLVPKIIDFGIAKAEAPAKTITYETKGTGLYIPPERDLYVECPITADVYQIGVMLMDVFVHDGDEKSQKFQRLLAEKTKKTIKELKKNAKISGDTHDIEFDYTWVLDREDIAQKSEELAKDHERIRKGALKKVTESIKVKNNPLMTEVIKKAMAADPENRYHSMASLRYDILLSTKKDELLELEKRAKAKKTKLTDNITLLNDIGSMLKDIELTDERKIRTDYRNGKVIDNSEISIGEHFLEVSEWEDTKNIRTLYREFQRKIDQLLPTIPKLCEVTGNNGSADKNKIDKNVDYVIEQAERYKQILQFEEKYRGIDTIIKYALGDSNAPNFEDNPIKEVLKKLFERRKQEATEECDNFLRDVQAYEKELIQKQLETIGEEVDGIGWTDTEFQRICSACEILLTVYEPGYTNKIQECNNSFYEGKSRK